MTTELTNILITQSPSTAEYTRAIQDAIDRACAGGGGVVTVAPGTYVVGTLYLRSHVTLRVSRGATLLGSTTLADYPSDTSGFVDAVGQDRSRCLIVGRGVTNVCIEGDGTIDGNGAQFKTPELYNGRPFLMRLIGCSRVTLRRVTLQNSAAWVCHLLDCEHVEVDSVTIRSRVNHNNDGIDIDSSRHVHVHQCDIDTGDDAVCLKSTLAAPCTDVRVNDCVLRTACGAIKIGTESYGDIRRVDVSNCRIEEAGLGGIKIISMDGARVEDVKIRDIDMANVTGPIFVRLGARLRTYRPGQTPRECGVIRGVSIRDIRARVNVPATGATNYFTKQWVGPAAFSGILVTGIPGQCVEDIEFDRLTVSLAGGGTAEDALVRPSEQLADYPEAFYFGVLPAWAIYLRHVRGVTLTECSFTLQLPDHRPMIFSEDVEGASGFDLPPKPEPRVFVEKS